MVWKEKDSEARSSRRSLCVVEPEASHNMSKIIFEYSKTLSPYIKKAVVSVMRRLNAQFTCRGLIKGRKRQVLNLAGNKETRPIFASGKGSHS